MSDGSKTWKVTLHRTALKELQRLPKPIVQRAWSVIEDLATNPLPPSCQLLRGTDSTYRIRISDYRLIYSISHATVTILVLRIGHRKDIYRDI
jgi:mRNA interferase RelE/StbE